MEVLWRPDVTEFAGESLRAVKKRLSRTEKTGHLCYRAPRGGTIQVIIGDVAFPGSTAVETVERYLKSG
jgi:hypothetical protein